VTADLIILLNSCSNLWTLILFLLNYIIHSSHISNKVIQCLLIIRSCCNSISPCFSINLCILVISHSCHLRCLLNSVDSQYIIIGISFYLLPVWTKIHLLSNHSQIKCPIHSLVRNLGLKWYFINIFQIKFFYLEQFLHFLQIVFKCSFCLPSCISKLFKH
jgi:hypothetical protein